MVLYFSGTGNSRYVAKVIGEKIGDDVISMNELIKGEQPAMLKSDKPYVFVCPTYAWRVPRIVERFLLDARLAGSRQAYFILTCGTSTGDAIRYASRLCHEKSLYFMGLAGIVMPENYIVMFKAPDRKEADAIIAKAGPHILEAAELIKAGKPLPAGKKTGRLMSGPVNTLYYKFMVNDKGFYATDQCISCGKCTEVCPLNNVCLEKGRPLWGGSCTHCMACICLCPTQAIEYKNKAKGKPRYHLDDEKLRV